MFGGKQLHLCSFPFPALNQTIQTLIIHVILLSCPLSNISRDFSLQATHLSEDEEIVETLRLQRRLYGEYGAASGISVAKLWPSKEELELLKEYEKVARPQSVHEMISMARKAKEDEEAALQQR